MYDSTKQMEKNELQNKIFQLEHKERKECFQIFIFIDKTIPTAFTYIHIKEFHFNCWINISTKLSFFLLLHLFGESTYIWLTAYEISQKKVVFSAAQK